MSKVENHRKPLRPSEGAKEFPERLACHGRRTRSGSLRLRCGGQRARQWLRLGIAARNELIRWSVVVGICRAGPRGAVCIQRLPQRSTAWTPAPSRSHHSPVRVLAHIKKLDDCLGDFLVRVTCKRGAVREITPEARRAWSAGQRSSMAAAAGLTEARTGRIRYFFGRGRFCICHQLTENGCSGFPKMHETLSVTASRSHIGAQVRAAVFVKTRQPGLLRRTTWRLMLTTEDALNKSRRWRPPKPFSMGKTNRRPSKD